ncbi:hypothetical protein ACFYXH_10060 [Streptomyces sp. NPDC002730]|uniref:hypothetical protein n=1 Tax=Streptomyces sp. NPDC002730 TaxID=3364662 RepID=UPI0036C1CC08
MEQETVPDGPLNDAEWEQFRQLLRRYLRHELDQWETWKTDTPYGPAYALLTRALPAEAMPEYFQSI